MGHAELNSNARRIVISEFMDETAVAALASRFDVHYDKQLVDRRGELELALADADALIVRNRTDVDAALLAAAPRLSVVGRLGVGLDNVDTAICAARGIEVIPATGANALAVAEYVIATAMLLLRGAYSSTTAVTAGEWPRASLSQGRELHGKTLGVIGFGSIGRRVARLAHALGMRVIGYDANVPSDSAIWADEHTIGEGFSALIAEADVITLHVPLTPATRGLLDAACIATMKVDVVLINTARGGIVDEAVVANALRNGKLGGAALDVFDTEPLAVGSPLFGCPNLILTPHIAGVTRESNIRVSSLIAENVAAALTASR
jgi:(S)-sulfolactate dehydrogenase